MRRYWLTAGGSLLVFLSGCAAVATGPPPSIDLKTFDCATSPCALKAADVVKKRVLFPAHGTAKDYVASTSYQVGRQVVQADYVQLVYTTPDGTTYVLSGWDGEQRGRGSAVARTPTLSPVTVRRTTGSWQQDEHLTEVTWTEGSWHWGLAARTDQATLIAAANDLN